MFIDVTRHGGGRALRVAIAAIAYVDGLDDGASLHLTGGQRLHIDETAEEIERRCQLSFGMIEGVAAMIETPITQEFLQSVAKELAEIGAMTTTVEKAAPNRATLSKRK